MSPIFRLRPPFTGPGRVRAFVLALLLVGACTRTPPAPIPDPIPDPSPAGDGPAAASPAASPAAGDGGSAAEAPTIGDVTPVAPVLRVSFTTAVTPEAAQAIRSVQGVVAAGRVALADVSVESKPGQSDLTVAAVDPLEFRPLAPASTAHSQFVWRGLLAGKLYLAHEEQGRLAVGLGDNLLLTGPSGRAMMPLAGLAANGVPNLAGAMVSLDAARPLGIGEPRMMLVGVQAGDSVDRVRAQIRARLPGAEVGNTQVLAAGEFITGPAAAKAFGVYRYQPGTGGSVIPEASWVRRNITTQSVPILGKVTCNRLMFPQLAGALKQIQDEGLASKINVGEFFYAGGCYNPRYVDRDPHRGLSRHAWGLAIDINGITNPEGAPSRQDPGVVAAFERWGFRWGGRWNPPDAMHFELAGLLK
jgi:hypothetical protein